MAGTNRFSQTSNSGLGIPEARWCTPGKRTCQTPGAQGMGADASPPLQSSIPPQILSLLPSLTALPPSSSRINSPAPSARASRGSSSSSSHAPAEKGQLGGCCLRPRGRGGEGAYPPRQRAGIQDAGMAGVCEDLRESKA